MKANIWSEPRNSVEVNETQHNSCTVVNTAEIKQGDGKCWCFLSDTTFQSKHSTAIQENGLISRKQTENKTPSI